VASNENALPTQELAKTVLSNPEQGTVQVVHFVHTLVVVSMILCLGDDLFFWARMVAVISFHTMATIETLFRTALILRMIYRLVPSECDGVITNGTLTNDEWGEPAISRVHADSLPLME
jgi:hypothetical protein